MNRHVTAVALGMLAATGGVSLARATPSPTGPYVAQTEASSGHGEAAQNAYGTTSATSPSSDTYILPAMSQATITPSTPLVSVTASAPAADSIGDNYSASASGTLTYQLEVQTFFTNEVVPVDITGTIDATLGAGATAQITDPSGASVFSIDATDYPHNTAENGVYDTIYPFMPNVTYTVSLFANASASSTTYASSSAAVDPTFTIEAPYASEAQIVLSDGIGNGITSTPTPVPEPSTLALFLSGVSIVSLAKLHRRTKLGMPATVGDAPD